MGELEAAMAEAGTSSSIAKSTSDARQYTEGDAARLNAALGLGAISFVLWAITIITSCLGRSAVRERLTSTNDMNIRPGLSMGTVRAWAPAPGYPHRPKAQSWP